MAPNGNANRKKRNRSSEKGGMHCNLSISRCYSSLRRVFEGPLAKFRNCVTSTLNSSHCRRCWWRWRVARLIKWRRRRRKKGRELITKSGWFPGRWWHFIVNRWHIITILLLLLLVISSHTDFDIFRCVWFLVSVSGNCNKERPALCRRSRDTEEGSGLAWPPSPTVNI